MALNINWNSGNVTSGLGLLNTARENDLARADKRQENVNKAIGDIAKQAKNYKDIKARQETSDKALEHYKQVVAEYEAKYQQNEANKKELAGLQERAKAENSAESSTESSTATYQTAGSSNNV